MLALKNAASKDKDPAPSVLSTHSPSSSDDENDDSLIPIRIASKDRKNMRWRYYVLYDNGKWYDQDAEDLAVKAPLLVQAYEKDQKVVKGDAEENKKHTSKKGDIE